MKFSLLLDSARSRHPRCRAQNNYEIQVYGADTVAPRSTMVELHSNFTADGQRTFIGTACARPITPNTKPSKSRRASTTGLRLASTSSPASSAGQGVQWVGDHIRPRVRVPEKWRWPVGVSLSTEFGYQRARYSPDTWDWEIRPIVDKTSGRWYFAVNPALERAWHGPDVNLGIDFSPAVKISYDFTKQITGGFEYYADYGSITNIASLHDQQQQIFPAIDLNVSARNGRSTSALASVLRLRLTTGLSKALLDGALTGGAKRRRHESAQPKRSALKPGADSLTC